MKKILLIAFSFSLLCMAAAEMTAGVPKKETATETILEFTQEANQVMIEKKEETATILEEPTAQPVAAQSKVTDSKPQESKADAQRQLLEEKIFLGEYTEADLDRYTQSLGPEIAQVYGWEIPAQQYNHKNTMEMER